MIAPAEASSNLARFDGLRFGYCLTSNYSSLAKMYSDNRSAGFGEEVQRRILVGSFVLSSRSYASYFQKAQSVRRLIAEEYGRVFEHVDCLLTPTASSPGKLLDDIRTQSSMFVFALVFFLQSVKDFWMI